VRNTYRPNPWMWLAVVALGVIAFWAVLQWLADDRFGDIVLAGVASVVVMALALATGAWIRSRSE
jgi:hypothetical protein